jgi:hypothetical protein
MAEETNAKKISLEELTVSTLAMSDALAKLMIAKGIITDEEFKAQLNAERAELSGCVGAVALNPSRMSM